MIAFNGFNQETNNLADIRAIFYRLINDKNITLEEVREISKQGYQAATSLNDDIKQVYSNIGRLFTI